MAHPTGMALRQARGIFGAHEAIHGIDVGEGEVLVVGQPILVERRDGPDIASGATVHRRGAPERMRHVPPSGERLR